MVQPMALPAVAWDQVLSLLAPLPLVFLANLAERGANPGEGESDVKRGTIASGWVGFVRAPGALGLFTWAVLLVIAMAVLVFGAGTARLEAASSQRDAARLSIYGLLEAVTGVAAAAVLLRPVRLRISRLLPIDPDSPVHATALVLSVILFGTQVAAQLTLNVLGQAAGGRGLQPVDLIVQELPFALLALVGVGVFVRRDPGQALRRLGLVRPRLYQLFLALAAAGAFYAVSTGMDVLGQRLTPDLSRQVGAASQRLFGQLDNPLGIATIALAAGICEEVLFRGALQPRLGLIWTALLFAAVHTEYGFSLDVAAVFVLAVALGLIRMFANTTTSAICHVAYNALVGVGVVQSWGVLPSIWVEAALVAATAGTWFSTRRMGNASAAR
jgi:membrane protease YdiL (CAAX protease family)